MRVGTKSLLYGVHQVFLHPWFVAFAWWKLYGFPFDPRLWVAFIVHDWGYWGKADMDGVEGEMHPVVGAYIMRWLFDWPRIKRYPLPLGGWKRDYNYEWLHFCLFHSRYFAKMVGQRPSRLCMADKLAIALMPWWLYLPLAWITGELTEYMAGTNARTPAGTRSARAWYRDVQNYRRNWAYHHRDGKPDTWTGTIRDLAAEKGAE